MITREQVADLREGDVVEINRPGWTNDTTLRGPLVPREGGLYVGDELVQWDGDGDKRIAWMVQDGAGLTVVSRAPRPLYVNHPRTGPVPGDVARQESGCPAAHTWHYLGDGSDDEGAARWWRFDDTRIPFDKDAPLRLLVDGETGQVVP